VKGTFKWATRAMVAGAIAVGASALPVGAALPPPPPRDITRFACPPSEVPPGGFVDSAGVFQEEIDCIKWYGITSGGPGGRPANEYGPGLSVARGQMAAFIVRFFDYVDPDRIAPYDGQNGFTDVPNDHTHVAPINRLADAGIVTGGPGGAPPTIYAPEDPVTRGQMASFIARMLGNLLEAELCVNVQNYFDDDDDTTHEACTNGLADIAIVAGTGPGTFEPANPVSRGQMSGFIMRAMDLLVEQELASRPAS